MRLSGGFRIVYLLQSRISPKNKGNSGFPVPQGAEWGGQPTRRPSLQVVTGGLKGLVCFLL